MDNFIIYGHRGAPLHKPENTLSSFREAIRLGANGIELDIHMTKDGHLVVIHDPTLERTTNGKGYVHRHTLREIKRLRADRSFHLPYEVARVPTLAEIFHLVRKLKYPPYLNIELKNLFIPYRGMEENVIRLLQTYRLQKRCVISSYNFHSLQKIKKLAPEVKTALLYFGRLSAPWSLAQTIGASAIHPPVAQVSRAFVKASHRAGLKIFPYTVDEPQTMVRFIQWGVDGLITNDPLLARKVYAHVADRAK
ncbi:glycerophosphodiester phosphodiesterase [Bacillaceae bacterium]